jgi:uncharacterized protein YecA (UPF0149 family)
MEKPSEQFPPVGEGDDSGDDHVHGESCEHHHHPPQRFVTKIGRNEPCPCGSGRKYKKCCLGKE